MNSSAHAVEGLEAAGSPEQAIMPSRRAQVKMVCYSGVFAAGGVYVALSGDGGARVIGALAAVFAMWALISFWRRFRSHAAIVLSGTGLRLPLGGEIAWADLDDVGVVKYKGTKLVGLRLRSTERFIASFTDRERAALGRNARWLRMFSRGIGAAQLATFKVADPGSYDVLVDEDRRSLDEIAKDRSLSTVAGTIAFARKHYGYDWTLGSIELDRSPAQFVALLNERRSAWRHRGAPA
jgi:hypothetical protein